MAEKPKVIPYRQGTAIIEYYKEDYQYLMMLPDGTVEHSTSKKGIERLAKKWSRDNLPPGYNAGVLVLDWR